jgi:cytochrome d ubiquinol oxidase subunit I
MGVAVVTAIAQPLAGHYAASVVARTQPVKLAAMEGQFVTEARAPLRIGGWPDENAGTTRFSVEIPGGLSYLAHGDIDATVQGLNDFPRGDWPPVAVVHVAFQVMVGLGMLMLGVAAWYLLTVVRGRALPDKRALLAAIAVCSPAGMIAIEAGWVVTEVGRQPWIIHGVMRTKDAVTPMPGLIVPMVTFSVVYLVLAGVVGFVFVHQVRSTPPDIATKDAASGN